MNGTPVLEKPLLICLSQTGRADASNKWYSRQPNKTWKDVSAETGYSDIAPGTINATLKGKLEGIKQELQNPNDQGYPPLGYILKLDYVLAGNDNIKYVTGDNNDPRKRVITVAKGNTAHVPSGYIRYDHKLNNGDPFTLGFVRYNDIPLTLNPTPSETVTAVYVYYEKENDRDHQFPLIVCVKKQVGQTYYTRGQTWNVEPSLNQVNPESTVATEIDKIRNELEKLKDKYEINIKEVPGLSEGNKSYKANAAGSEITVEKKTNTDEPQKVPTGYIRYKHYSTSDFKLGLVRYKDIPLKFSENLPTDVQAVYVYYSDSAGDPYHEFPLIVCVDTGNDSTRKYYKRGNRWTQIPALASHSPTSSGVADKLSGPLGQLIVKYEVKLEKDNQPATGYKGRPQSTADTITVTTVGPNSGYQGFKHDLKAADKTINRMTIHGHIVNVGNLGTGGTIENKQYVYVYFEKTDAENDRKKPLLICLAESESASPNNKWYKRTGSSPNYTWEDANTKKEYDSIAPGQISQLAENLGKIKTDLTDNDEGYKKPDYVLKLDYVAKDTTNGITYVTGNDPDPSKRVIAVEKNTTIAGYVAYEHKCTGNITNVTFKHNGVALPKVPTGITIEQNKKVWVFYEDDGQGNPNLETPLLLYFKRSDDSSNNWYGKGKKWVKHSNLDKVDASGGLPEKNNPNHNKISSKLNAIIFRHINFESR